jgi:hypothetical protein
VGFVLIVEISESSRSPLSGAVAYPAVSECLGEHGPFFAPVWPFVSCCERVKILMSLAAPLKKGHAMTKTDVWKLQPADLRRMAARTQEPERERKLLTLAKQLEEKEPAAPKPPEPSLRDS